MPKAKVGSVAVAKRGSVAPETLARLRSICLALPEAIEEPAWVGTRWRVRQQTFAHVLMIEAGWPPAYARAAGSSGPLCVLTFRSPLPELDAYAFAEAPYFRPGWWPDIVGMAIGAQVDWAEVGDLITDSYVRLAPKKLARAIGAAPG